MIKKLISIAITAAALATAPASAQSQADQVNQTMVSYADLNLSSAAGRATLDSRIAGAARMVCGPTKAPSLAEHKFNRDCRDGAIAGANAKLEQVLASRGSGTVVAVRR
jgi:UrcA family protein